MHYNCTGRQIPMKGLPVDEKSAEPTREEKDAVAAVVLVLGHSHKLAKVAVVVSASSTASTRAQRECRRVESGFEGKVRGGGSESKLDVEYKRRRRLLLLFLLQTTRPFSPLPICSPAYLTDPVHPHPSFLLSSPSFSPPLPFLSPFLLFYDAYRRTQSVRIYL